MAKKQTNPKTISITLRANGEALLTPLCGEQTRVPPTVLAEGGTEGARAAVRGVRRQVIQFVVAWIDRSAVRIRPRTPCHPLAGGREVRREDNLKSGRNLLCRPRSVACRILHARTLLPLRGRHANTAEPTEKATRRGDSVRHSSRECLGGFEQYVPPHGPSLRGQATPIGIPDPPVILPPARSSERRCSQTAVTAGGIANRDGWSLPTVQTPPGRQPEAVRNTRPPSAQRPPELTRPRQWRERCARSGSGPHGPDAGQRPVTHSDQPRFHWSATCGLCTTSRRRTCWALHSCG